MTTRHDPFKAEFGDLLGPTHWPSLLPDEARQAWVDLRGWVEALVDRFDLESRLGAPCWYRRVVVEVPDPDPVMRRISARGRWLERQRKRP